MCLSLNGILSAGERFSFGFSDSAHKPIDHFKKKKKGTWGRGGAEGIRSTEMSAELCAARLVLTYCQRVNAMMEN